MLVNIGSGIYKRYIGEAVGESNSHLHCVLLFLLFGQVGLNDLELLAFDSISNLI